MTAKHPQPGAGTRIAVRGDQYSVAANVRGGRFPHPFRPSVAGLFLTLSLGVIDGVWRPTIGGVPLGTVPPPRLKLDAKKCNAAGESWVCVEVEAGLRTVLPDGAEPQLRSQLGEGSRVEIVQRATAPAQDTPDAAIGREPLVLLVFAGDRVALVHSIADGNLRYRRVDPGPGGGAVEHLFF